MIKRNIKTSKLPDIIVHYCTSQQEAYDYVEVKHGVEMMNDLVNAKDFVYSFSIVNSLDDNIELYFNMDVSNEKQLRASIISETIHASISQVRRKIYMTMDEDKVVGFGHSQEMDDVIVEHIANNINRVLYEE